MPSVGDIKAIAEMGSGSVALIAVVGVFIWMIVFRDPKLQGLIVNNTVALSNNTKAIESFQTTQQETTATLQDLSHKMATRDDLCRIHDRLDVQGGDIKTIMGKLNC